jgi:hypothetical protein
MRSMPSARPISAMIAGPAARISAAVPARVRASPSMNSSC